MDNQNSSSIIPAQQAAITPGGPMVIEIADALPAAVNPVNVYLSGLVSAQSERTMRAALNEIARMIGAQTVEIDNPGGKRKKTLDMTALTVQWHALRYQHTAAIRARLIERYPAATANKMLSALRGVLKEAWRLGLMSAEDYRRAVDLKGVKGETIPAGREITDGEILALVKVCKRDKTPSGARDAALIGVLFAGGLRRAEVAALDMDNYNHATGRIDVKRGKGGKDRTVYLTNGAKTALDVWLIERGMNPGKLFTPILKSGQVQPEKPMSAQAIYNMLVKRGKEAELSDFSPHDFRRTFISTLLDRSVDIATVSKLAGHADPKTTARYDRRGEETKQRAAEKIHFPF